MNTLILSESGGSQGLGFAIPSAIVASAFPQLQKYGHLHRGLLGFSMQAVTPTLAAALELPRTTGVMVSDVMPDGPADTAGLGVKDLIATVNGKHVDSVPMLSLELSRSVAGDTVVLGVMRGNTIAPIRITVAERPHPIDRLADLSDPEKSAVPQLGIIGIDINDDTAALLPSLRIPSGVLVAARTQGVVQRQRASRRRGRDSLREHAPGEEPRRAAGVSRPRRRQSRPGAANRTQRPAAIRDVPDLLTGEGTELAPHDLMSWVFWLAVAVVIAAIAAVTGMKPAGTRPVARTGLMAVARVVLIIFVVIVIALFLTRRAREGPPHTLLRPVTEISAGRAAAVMVVARPADF